MNIGVVVKVSKLCNLRCVYCCETPELNDPRRMSVEDVKRMFANLNNFLKKFEEKHELTFYWHGGEPFAQPISYWERIFQGQIDEFGEEFVDQSIVNPVQSNITLLTEKHLPLIRKFMRLGFSYDVVNHLRINSGGKETDQLVRRKVRWLRANGIPIGGLAVISQANVNREAEIADYFIGENLQFRLLHIDEGLDQIPQIRPVTVSFHEYLAFLKSFYELPQVQKALISGLRIEPFSTAMEKWNNYRSGYTGAYPSDDLSALEYLLEVNTDGQVYSPADYPYRNSYGNIFSQSIEDLLLSDGRRKRISRSKERLQAVCEKCILFRHGCNGTFVSHATPEQYVEIEEAGECYLSYITSILRTSSFVDREHQLALQH